MNAMRCCGLVLMALATGGLGCAACHTCDDCDCANKTCHVAAKPGKETRTCWEVDCEDVCVPGDIGPCDDPCAPRCGRVRSVAVLRRDKSELDVCEYEWSVEQLCPVCGRRHPGAGCTAPELPPAPGD